MAAIVKQEFSDVFVRVLKGKTFRIEMAVFKRVMNTARTKINIHYGGIVLRKGETRFFKKSFEEHCIDEEIRLERLYSHSPDWPEFVPAKLIVIKTILA